MQKLNKFLIFVFVISILIFIWTVVSYWQRFFDNLIFLTFKFDPANTTQTFIAAISITMTMFFLAWIIKVTIFNDVDIYIVGDREKKFEGKLEERGISERGIGEDRALAGDRFSPSVLSSVPGVPFV